MKRFLHVLIFCMTFSVHPACPDNKSCLAPKTMTNAKSEAAMNRAIESMLQWLTDHEYDQTQVFLPLNSNAPASMLSEFEDYFRKNSPENTHFYGTNFLDEVHASPIHYHGTNLFFVLLMERLGYFKPWIISEICHKYLDDEYDSMFLSDSIFFMTPLREEARNYAITGCASLSLEDLKKGHFENKEDWIRFLHGIGIPLEDPEIQRLLITPVVLEINLKKHYPQKGREKIFYDFPNTLDEFSQDEVLAPYPPLDFRSVKKIFVRNSPGESKKRAALACA